MSLLHIVGALLILGNVVLVHEAGHLLVALKLGVKVDEFAVGFGPKILCWKYGGVEFSIRLLPWGGYIKISEAANTNNIGTDVWSLQPAFTRFAIGIAGPLTNFIVAMLIFTFISFIEGVPNENAIIGQVSGKAAQAGLLQGDEIIKINDQYIKDWTHAEEFVWASLEIDSVKFLRFTVARDEKELSFALPLESQKNLFQIGLEQEVHRFRPISALTHGVESTFLMIGISQKSIISVLDEIGRKDTAVYLTGPVGIIHAVTDISNEAFAVGGATGLLRVLLFILTIMNIGIGLFNLLPIPGLDGGNIILSLITAIRGHSDPKKEAVMIWISNLTIIILFIWIFINDLRRIFGNG